MADSLFQQPSFLRAAVFYEVNIRQYTPEGTFKAFYAHLPRLKDMGVDVLWLMPVHRIGEERRKGVLGSYYSIADHRSVNPEFGSPEDLKELIGQVHGLGMKLIIDWVANHTSRDHVWTKQHPEFYVTDNDGNFCPPFDWDDVFQLDHSHTVQQAAMINAMQYWVTEFDIDGFRADMAHLVPLAFWKGARSLLSAQKKDLIWLGETEERSYYEAFDIMYAWNWMHKTESLCRNEISVHDLKNFLVYDNSELPRSALRLFFTSNHDENSWNGTEYEKYGFMAAALAVFTFTFPGVPLVYSGQEIPNLKRLKFFEKDTIAPADNFTLHSFYKALADLRKRNAAIVSQFSNIDFLEVAADHILAYSVSAYDKNVAVFINAGNEDTACVFEHPVLSGDYTDIFTGMPIICTGSISLILKRGEFLVLEK